VASRVKIWRRLARAGAVPLKGAVYILPDSDEHYEFFQWLSAEAVHMKGEAGFLRAERLESMDTAEITALFNRQREKDYARVEEALTAVSRRLDGIRKGGRPGGMSALRQRLFRLLREFGEIRKIDFFSAPAGEALGKRFAAVEEALGMLAQREGRPGGAEPPVPRRGRDFRGKVWVTRKRPFVDRMASAWLIRKFIDKNATFEFADEKEIQARMDDSVSFDVQGGQFTHVGELCTFEVLMKAFGIREPAVKRIARIVHELDLKDGKYKAPEAPGIEYLLRGIRNTAKTDAEALERGMAAFEALYASRSGAGA